MAETTGKVVHVNLDAFDVYIGRACRGYKASPWRNTFRLSLFSLPDSLKRYESQLRRWLKNVDAVSEFKKLRGKTLGCWCAKKGGLTIDDPLRCHGQIMLRILDEIFKEQANGEKKE